MLGKELITIFVLRLHVTPCYSVFNYFLTLSEVHQNLRPNLAINGVLFSVQFRSIFDLITRKQAERENADVFILSVASMKHPGSM